jgi:hypothetical protein
LFITNGRDHPKKIAIETAIRIGDISAISRSTTVLAKYRLASEEIMVGIIVMITIGVMSNRMIIEIHRAPADKIVDPGFRGHTTCHPKIF